MNEQSPVETRILQVSDGYAGRLGFPLEKFQRTVEKKDEAYVVEYFPRDPTRRGGGLEIWVDGKTLKVIRKIYTQ